MVTKDQVRALVTCHVDGDGAQFCAVVTQIAAEAARAGEPEFAQELRDLVKKSRERSGHRRRTASVVPFAQPKGELAQLLDLRYPEDRLTDLLVTDKVHDRLSQVVLEQRDREVLADKGLKPARHLLLAGPPGTGKTFAARVIAGELGLPLFSIKFDKLLPRVLGGAAANLRLIFDAIVEARGVYLFDHVDAFAVERITQNELGEIRRMLNAFLQFLEQDRSDSVIIAATNLPALLDEALFCRFDTVVEFEMPDSFMVERLIVDRLASFHIKNLSWPRIFEEAQGLSHAEVATAAENAAKRTVMAQRTRVLTDVLISALREPAIRKYWAARRRQARRST